jgi:hypothetical protein
LQKTQSGEAPFVEPLSGEPLSGESLSGALLSGALSGVGDI